MKTIKFSVSALGKVSLEVTGAVGTTCKDLTKPYEDALGGEATVVAKPEMDQVDLGGAKEQQGAFTGF